MTACKMTGIGFYGQPHQLTKMLAKLLMRYDRVPLAIQPDGLLDDPQAAENGRHLYAGGRQPLNATQVRAAMMREAKLTGFFLAITEGRAELHFRLRGGCKGDAQSRGVRTSGG